MRTKARILVVDDDKSVVEALSVLLEHAGYTLSIAYNAHEALRRAYEDHPDLVLLDVNLPDQDGFSVLGRLREQTDVPILMLTARTQVEDRVRGLDAGAVDYILKPFDMQELLARVRRNLRDDQRRAAGRKNMRSVDEHLSVDLGAHRLMLDGSPIELTPIEWRLLRRLMEAEGQVVSAEDLLRAGWGNEELRDTRSIKVRISSIRHKLGDKAYPSRYIHTEREAGYRFGLEE